MLENFIIGSGGQITTWNMIEGNNLPVVLRGIAKRKQIHTCWQTKRDFYYIDTGYFGNGKRKLYHRITKNHLQNIYPIINRPRDRLLATGYKPHKFSQGSNILICPPSAKVMKFYDLDLDQWMEETLLELKKHTDREIVIREKASRIDRTQKKTIYEALDDDVFCMVTYQSIAAVESIAYGIPAFTLAPSAAKPVSLQDLSKIETPYYPDEELVHKWASSLAYGQFNLEEMLNGYAWHTLMENKNRETISS
jgi:hypothetical protein